MQVKGAPCLIYIFTVTVVFNLLAFETAAVVGANSSWRSVVYGVFSLKKLISP